MTDFKVGDRVKVIDYQCSDPRERAKMVGKYGAISVEGKGSFFGAVLDGNDFQDLFFFEELQLIRTATHAHDVAWYEAELDKRDEQVAKLTDALKGIYEILPRYSCKSMEPDGCAVCAARSLLRGDG